jgi:hypothetical protein
MRRVLQYISWQSGWWTARASVRDSESVELRDGLAAYARMQASIHGKVEAHFRREWSVSVGFVAKSVVEATDEDRADLVQLFA